jgi:hypothetical protein
MSNPPIFPCVGGKGRLRRWLTDLMGPLLIDSYIEPFAGHANVFLLAASSVRAARWWLNDLTTAPFLRMLSEGVGADLPEDPSNTPVSVWKDRARAGSKVALALAPFITWGAKGYSAAGAVYRPAGYCPEKLGRKLAAARDVMAGVRPLITGKSYHAVLCAAGPDDFAYLDPPYEECSGTPYPPIRHEELLALLPRLRCRWLLSGYDSDLYRRTLGAPAARNQLHIALGHRRGYRTECVWANFPLRKAAVQHDLFESGR